MGSAEEESERRDPASIGWWGWTAPPATMACTASPGRRTMLFWASGTWPSRAAGSRILQQPQLYTKHASSRILADVRDSHSAFCPHRAYEIVRSSRSSSTSSPQLPVGLRIDEPCMSVDVCIWGCSSVELREEKRASLDRGHAIRRVAD